MTAQQLIESSMRLIGVLAAEESLSSADGSNALVTLNSIIDSWSTQQLLIPNKVRETFALAANTTTYTMGTGATWNTTRPMKIENALIQLTASNPDLELPMEILTKNQYASILVKGSTSSYPFSLYPDYAYPTLTVSVFPVPDNATNNVVLYSWKPLTTLTALSTAISLPPGYQRALKYQLALELGPEYGRQPNEVVVAMASESKADIKRMNFSPTYLRVDNQLMGKPAVWNWMTGEST